MRIPVPADFSFRETVNAHGWRQLLPFSYDAETGVLERVERLPDGRVVLLTLHEDGDAVLAHATGAAGDEPEIARRVSRMLQLDLPMGEFHAFCRRHPKLAHVPARRQGRLLCGPTLWEDVVKVILTTNTTWTQTKAMSQRLVETWGLPLAADPARRAFPTPQQIAETTLEEFSQLARLGYRNGSVHSLAAAISTGALDLETVRDGMRTSAELRAALLALRGVGPYAASCLMIYLGRYDRVNVDSWARMMVAKEVGHAVTDAEVHAFFASYAPWQSLAYHFYPWAENLPVY